MQDPQPLPPPGGLLALEHVLLVMLFGGLAIVLVGDFLPFEWVQYYAPRLWMPVWAFGVLFYGGPRVAGRAAWMTKALRLGRGQLAEWGGGPYAAIGLACFLWQEWEQIRDFYQWIVETDWQAGHLARSLSRFFANSFMNGLYAFVWPAFWKKTFDAGQQWPAVVVAWTLFEAGKWSVRQLPRSEPPPA